LGSDSLSSGIVIEGIDTSTPNPSICLFPRHPQKYFKTSQTAQMQASTNKSNGRQSAPYDLIPMLLDVWPSYLERLLPTSPTRFIGTAFADVNSVGLSSAGANSNGSLLTGSSSASYNQNNGGGHSNTPQQRMHRVYESSSAGGRGIPSRCPAVHPYEVPVDGVGERFEHSLTFDSDFESGNLHMATQVSDATYDLFLRADMHTAGHTQWFYFSVSNTHPPALVRLAEQGVQVPPVRVRFNIVNLTKPDSLYNLGMRPVVYSCLGEYLGTIFSSQ
jgi:hypothetical protein